MLELKYADLNDPDRDQFTFNRTMLELKWRRSRTGIKTLDNF